MMQAAELLQAVQAARQQRGSGTTLDALVAALRLTAADLPEWAEALAQHAGVRVLAADAPMALHPAAASLLPATDVALVADDAATALLLMADPWDAARVQQCQLRCGLAAEPVAASAAQLAAVLQRPTERGQSLATGQDAVGIVDAALAAAWQRGASDVHFECDRQGLSVKHRLDGVMTPFSRVDSVQLAEEAISRIKVLSQLDITERRLPQDGRMRFSFEGQALDLRVSIMPSVFGEDAVLRLLDKSTLRKSEGRVTLETLGFADENARRLRLLASLPHGMLLVTGPTGSGKTTTLYAALSEINTGLEKIITIEDPVEYELPGVLQIPVNEKKGLTFARGLRSILRHDPDRILVGEIRDAETAEIAVQSALTGHLVFTTVHANSLFDVIGRFRHFSLDMFGFVSSLNGVVVQRLLRKLCPHCVAERPPTEAEAQWLHQHGQAQVRVPRSVGCAQCHGTGYKGRFVMAEVHVLNDHLRDRILAGAEVRELKTLVFGDPNVAGLTARKTPTLTQQALSMVAHQQTSLEELFRVVGQL
jgi:general secretion pathway protein E